MPELSRDALLCAVWMAVDTWARSPEALKRHKEIVVVWPYVTEIMRRLTGESLKGEQWRRKQRTLRDRRVDLAQLAGSVASDQYQDAVADVVAQGIETIAQKDDVAHKPTRKRPPTVEELDAITPEELLGLTDMSVKIEKAEAKARLYKRLYDEAIKRASFVEAACDALRDVVQAMPPAEWDPQHLPAIHMRREQDAVLVLSDIHVGDAIHPDTMGALNVYNYDIFCQKSKRLYAGVQESLEMFREWGNIRKLWVLGLGDWVTGTNIFPGQAHHIQIGAMKQAMCGAEEMARVFYEFQGLPGIEHIQMECVPGNHGRPGKKGQDPPEDNWDLVLYEFMRLRLVSQPHMTVNWHESWWMMPQIRGWNFLCAHGDEVRAWNGIPNYGFRRWAAKWREMLDSVGKRYDYGLIGHHHYEVEEGNLIISGAWPGASFFSAKFLQSGGAATQMFYSVADDYGITWRRRLPLDPPRRGVSEVETA